MTAEYQALLARLKSEAAKFLAPLDAACPNWREVMQKRHRR